MPVSVQAIDHIVIRIPDLDVGEPLFRRLGFVLTPRGFHAGRGSANHTVALPGGNYVELIQLPDGTPGNRFTERPEGPVAVVLRPATDSRTVHAELTALGLPVPDLRDLTRPVALPEGTRDARFIVATFPVTAPEALPLAVCQHLTPELIWRPEWEGHANGAVRVSGVIVVHPDPHALVPSLGALFGEGAVRTGEAGLSVTLGPDSIAILTPAAFTARFPSVPVPAVTERGWFAGATVDVPSLAVAEDTLQTAGIDHARTPAGTIAVPPSAAGGALLEFRAV